MSTTERTTAAAILRSALVVLPSVLVLALVVATTGASSGCTEPRSERCKNVCEREAQCAESTSDQGIRFDRQECVSACAALERDTEGKAYVARHVACAAKADSCEQLYACTFPYQHPAGSSASSSSAPAPAAPESRARPAAP